jgi:hypothetical protein
LDLDSFSSSCFFLMGGATYPLKKISSFSLNV